jgi:hypothetical protein
MFGGAVPKVDTQQVARLLSILQNLAIAKSGERRLHLHRAAALLEHATHSLQRARPNSSA